MRNFRTYGLCAVAAAALLAAGCGGGGGTRPEAPTPAASSPTPTPPAPAPANAVTLPADHGITEAWEDMIPAGETMKVAGVRFSCAAGEMACTVSVTVDADGMATATSSGGAVMARALDATGNQAFMNLSAALLDADQRADLSANLYHDIDESANNGGGVTTSLTTHEEPGTPGASDPLTGVSDIFVSVRPSVVRAMDSDDSKVVQVVDGMPEDDEDDEDDITDVTMYDQVRDPWDIMNPVLVDEDGMVTTERTSNFVADADWDLNPAAEWTTDPALMGLTQNMDDDEDDIWTNYFEATQDLAGGRTLHLDLRSDFDPNNTMVAAGMDIARGPDSEETDPAAEVRVDWDLITGLSAPAGGEINLAVDDGDDSNGIEGVEGTYMGVRGRFSCVDGTGGQDGNNICRINHHEPGMMSVSEDDTVVFRPYVYTPDTDWLAAGVWLTIPDDEAEGDYAIGAFVFGSDPYKADSESNAQSIEGTATYAGQAFGRYAEMDGVHTETGRFTADAVLMANFGEATEMGTIQGDLTGFVANGQSEDWDVNFERADVMMEMNDADPPQVVADTALRFNAGASGHARGHGMTGYWNGQFFGGDADNNAQPQPGSAAGTFGLTTERDNEDNYSLTMGGAFVTHREEPASN